MLWVQPEQLLCVDQREQKLLIHRGTAPLFFWHYLKQHHPCHSSVPCKIWNHSATCPRNSCADAAAVNCNAKHRNTCCISLQYSKPFLFSCRQHFHRGQTWCILRHTCSQISSVYSVFFNFAFFFFSPKYHQVCTYNVQTETIPIQSNYLRHLQEVPFQALTNRIFIKEV